MSSILTCLKEAFEAILDDPEFRGVKSHRNSDQNGITSFLAEVWDQNGKKITEQET
jgi:hypothetical protein